MPEKRDGLSEHTIDEIAELAAEKALAKFTDKLAIEVLAKTEEKFFASVGKHVLDNLMRVIGVIAVSALLWMAGTKSN